MNAPTLSPGGRIDPSKPLKSVRVAVLTVSDSRDTSNDTSGDILAERVAEAGHELIGRAIVRDDVDAIRKQVLAWVEAGAEAIVSTGGTGITGRDVTPEAIRPRWSSTWSATSRWASRPCSRGRWPASSRGSSSSACRARTAR